MIRNGGQPLWACLRPQHCIAQMLVGLDFERHIFTGWCAILAWSGAYRFFFRVKARSMLRGCTSRCNSSRKAKASALA